jgi:predicted RNA-binding Zn-ribbon protein involved in translation (DUF1610 family)
MVVLFGLLHSAILAGMLAPMRPRFSAAVCGPHWPILLLPETSMHPVTQDEIDKVSSYVESQDRKVKVTFAQKMYVENILGHLHEAWDVHCGRRRYWVITNPMNLYEQKLFPNMDLAITFHVGLCLRMPRSEREPISDLHVEPFAECARLATEASDELKQAEKVSDYQAIGVRCREVMLTLVAAAQVVMPWTGPGEPPQKANLKEWADHMCKIGLPGQAHKDRRKLLKTLLISTWDFNNWLAHTKSSTWHDAETGCTTTEHLIGIWLSILIRHVRKVPEACPACGSRRLFPQRARDPNEPAAEYERPACDKCGWIGEAMRITEVPVAPERPSIPPEGDCVIPTVPLKRLGRKPDR